MAHHGMVDVAPSGHCVGQRMRVERANEGSPASIQTSTHGAQFGRQYLEVPRTLAPVSQEAKSQDTRRRGENCATDLGLIALLGTICAILKPTPLGKRQHVSHNVVVRLTPALTGR